MHNRRRTALNIGGDKMTKREKQKLIDGIYDAVFNSALTRRIVRDTDWSHVRELQAVVNNYLAVWNNGHQSRLQCIRQEVYGYTSDNCMKQYLYTVVDMDTDERFVDGLINCHRAGTIADPWAAYDMTAHWYDHDED